MNYGLHGTIDLLYILHMEKPVRSASEIGLIELVEHRNVSIGIGSVPPQLGTAVYEGV